MADENDVNINIGVNPAGAESGSRRAKAAINSVTQESDGLQAAFRRIKTAIDPTYAAQERYNKLLADAKALLDANIIKKKEYNAAVAAAKTALDAEVAAIQRNSAAGRAAAAEAKAAKQAEAQAARDAAAAAAQAAREKAAAERQAAKQAAADAAAAKAAEKVAIREAAAAAKQAAKEKAAAERQAAQEIAAAAKAARQAETQAAREAAAQERAEAQARSQAEKAARQAEKQAAKDAATQAAQAARDKAAADRAAAQAAREAAKAEADKAKAEAQDARAAMELRASIDPAFASQMRFNNTMATATKLLNQNKITTQEWTAIQRQAKAQMDVNVRSLGRMNTMSVQLGYQMQDVTASVASGINPLVILAQQGGQTAAALSMMGGTVGRVAAFMAGPWGAAIIGVTMLLGYLWQSEEDGKKKTLDLNDAESRRTATVKELTQALRDYVAQQKEANNQDLINLENKRNLNMVDQARMQNAVIDAQQELNDAQRAYNDLISQPMSSSKGGMEAQAGMIAAALGRLQLAQKNLASAQKNAQTATDAVTESQIALAESLAKSTQADIDYQHTAQGIVDIYRSSSHTAADYQKMLADLRKANDDYTAAKERESEAHRENANAIKNEQKQIFQSRQAAIGMAGRELQQEGYLVGENNQFGGIHGYHPGMGNTAHAQFAIDVNIPGVGKESANAAAKRQMDEMVAAYQARGFRILWNGKVYQPYGGGPTYDIPMGQNQHLDHVHIEAPASIVGKPAGSKVANDLVENAQKVREEQKKLSEEELQDQVADLDMKKELYADDLYAVLQAQDEKEAAITAFYGATSRQAKDAHRETIKLEHQIAQESIKIERDRIQQKLALAQKAEESYQQVLAEQRGMESDEVEFESSNGLISQRKALADKKLILDEEYNAQVTSENKIYNLKVQAVRDQLALENLTLDARRQLLDQLETMQAEHNARMAQLNAGYARQSQNINLQTASVSLEAWRGMFTTVTQSLANTFQGLWTRSMTVWQGLINLGDQIVYKFADMGLKVLEDWMTKEAIKLGLIHVHQAQETAAVAAGEGARTGITASGEAARQGIGAAGVVAHGVQQVAKSGASVASEAVQTGAKVTGEATRGTVGAAGAIAEIGTRAATSAAGAFSSTVVIPFIGPVAAPVAAAAALAAVLGFAALVSARGGQAEVPFDGQMTQLHKKEMVLPAWAAEPLRVGLRAGPGNSALFGGAAAAGASMRDSIANSNVHFKYAPSYGGVPKEVTMDDLLRRDGDRLERWVRKKARDGIFQGGSKGNR